MTQIQRQFLLASGRKISSQIIRNRANDGYSVDHKACAAQRKCTVQHSDWIQTCSELIQGCGSPVVRVSDHGRYVMSLSPVPLKTRRVGQRCTLNLSRAETSSRWCGVVVRRGGTSSGVVHVS
ncbi:uncharacterized protein TNCV_3730851 [Trichonephila clavipes]|nr:uncharacterized protein TNCV_3730851 [Trichonephila clavipes]